MAESTAPTDSGLVGDNRVRRKKALVRCKACVRCRGRKVKCDGQRPCQLCRSQSEACIYSEDGRQSSRVSKANFRSMVDKIAVLENLVRGSGRPGSSDGRPDTPSFPQGNGQQSQDVNTYGSQALRESSIGDADHLDQVSTLQAVLNVQGDSLVSTAQGSPRSDPARQDTLPLGVHFVMADRGSVAVHGPSSAFHFHDESPSSMRLYPSPAEGQLVYSGETGPPSSTTSDNLAQIQTQLIANAALERQKETAFLLHEQHNFGDIDFDTAMHLLDLHWNRHHCLFFLSYRPLVMQNLLTEGPYANSILWNALFFASSLHSERDYPDGSKLAKESAVNKFYLRFQALVASALEQSSVPTVVALLVVGTALLSSGKQSAGWLYSGLAYRMILDLGLHLDDKRAMSSSSIASQRQVTFSPAETEMNRRVFWGAYVSDKFQSLYFGRPPALPAMGVEPPQTFLDTYEELELWSPYLDPQHPSSFARNYSPKPAYVVSSFQALLRLAEISSEIISRFYMPWFPKLSSSSARRYLTGLQKKLQEWQEKLPAHLRFAPDEDETPPPHQITPHSTFHTLQILLHRPFLPEGHLHHLGLADASTRNTCTTAALKIYDLTRAYRTAFGLRYAPYLFSYALFCAATVLPQQEAQRDVILFFWQALQELQQGANLSLKKPLMIIRDLMERAGVDISALAAASEAQAGSSSDDQIANATEEPDTLVDPFVSQLLETYELFQTTSENPFDWLNQSPMEMDAPNVLYGLFQ